MKNIIRFNFYLSTWFAGKGKKEIFVKGTSFLFLNQMSFMIAAFFLAVWHFAAINVSAEIVSSVLMLIILFIMFGFQ